MPSKYRHLHSVGVLNGGFLQNSSCVLFCAFEYFFLGLQERPVRVMYVNMSMYELTRVSPEGMFLPFASISSPPCRRWSSSSSSSVKSALQPRSEPPPSTVYPSYSRLFSFPRSSELFTLLPPFSVSPLVCWDTPSFVLSKWWLLHSVSSPLFESSWQSA